tara:strand:+ start:6758 stop:8683 length:1926 start_codon:yes stop_codon:yes gene_type:complete
MAQKSLLKNSDSLGNIRKSLMSFGDGLRSANSTSSNIVSDLNLGNREKKRAILRSDQIFETRRQAVQRREREDVIEAGKIGSITTRATRTITSSTKGFLGRVMDFVGTIFVGWILTNLPTIIKQVRGLIERIQQVQVILQSWVNNVQEFYTDFTAQLDTFLDRISIIIDDTPLTESNRNNKKLESSVNTIERDFNRMIQGFKDFNLKEFIFGEKPKPSGSGSGSGTGSSTTGRYAPILNVIGKGEGGYTSIAPGDQNPNLTSMTIEEASKAVGLDGGKGAIGRYQLTDPIRQATEAGLDVKTDLFNSENQDKIAISLIKARGITADMIINNPNEAAKRLAMEFAGIPVLAPTQGYLGNPIERGQSFYSGYNGNKARNVTPEDVEAAFKQFGQAKVSPNINRSTKYSKNQNISSVVGQNATITSLKGMRTDPISGQQRFHSGIDIACAPGLYISLKVDCEVVGSKFDGGYGNVIDVWVPSLGVQMRFAHNTSIIIKGGNIPAGTSFAITGSTGRSTGSHIHFEVDSRRNRTGYKSNMVPDPYVAMIELTTVEIKGTNTASSFTKSSNQTLISSSTNRTTTQQSVTPTKKSRTIPIPIPSSNNTTTQQAPAMSGGGSQTIAFNSENQLNNFVSLILLAELGNV